MIALFTDYGHEGPYVGQVHAVIAALAPGVRVLDLMHDVPAFHVRSGAHLLAACVTFLPPGTVCLAVVDPGVGGPRRGLVLSAGDWQFVGPDNGLLSIVSHRFKPVKCQTIDWIPENRSASFHGRDWFAPVAARLALGQSIPGVLTEPVPISGPNESGDLDEIIYIDRFGNAVMGRRVETLNESSSLSVSGRVITYGRVFSDVPEGHAFWYGNANGLVEIAVNQMSAEKVLSLKIGDAVRVVGRGG